MLYGDVMRTITVTELARNLRQVLADLYRTLPEEAGRGWLKDSQNTELGETLAAEIRDPWDS